MAQLEFCSPSLSLAVLFTLLSLLFALQHFTLSLLFALWFTLSLLFLLFSAGGSPSFSLAVLRRSLVSTLTGLRRRYCS
ncbi:hypothetical protein BVRB_004040 [Beta vulgaris subsp. vulgaris]|uniref:Uncharacterized protein n=1 Tax=Beta vulgaris subsp. vulgaris TaxID=3555 RepID=A0A0J8B3Y1_BETVV|nr:hypothetical protein BVRB_004040 [Beta vulgaris subsp. vulgaris]